MTRRHYLWAQETEMTFDSASERWLYLELCYQSDNKGVVRYSQSELAELTLLSVRRIKSLFKLLMEHGFVTKLGHGRYLLNITDHAKQSGAATISPSALELFGIAKDAHEWLGLRYTDAGKAIIVDNRSERHVDLVEENDGSIVVVDAKDQTVLTD